MARDGGGRLGGEDQTVLCGGPTWGKGDAQSPQPLLRLCRLLAQASIGVKRQRIEGEVEQALGQLAAQSILVKMENIEVGQAA